MMRYHDSPSPGDLAGTGPRTAPGDGSGTWVPVAETARRLGVSSRAVRKRIERGTLTARPRGNEGREVFLPNGTRAGPVPEQGPRTGAGSGSADGSAASQLEAMLQVARLEVQLAEREAAAARVGAELRGAVAELRITVTDLRETVAAERSRADRLEAALAEARKPVLVRLLEALRRRN